MSLLAAIACAYVYAETRLDNIRDLLVQNGTRLAAIEANRFTAADALHHRDVHASEREYLESRLPDEIPPKWIVDMVTTHGRRIESLEKKVNGVPP